MSNKEREMYLGVLNDDGLLDCNYSVVPSEVLRFKVYRFIT